MHKTKKILMLCFGLCVLLTNCNYNSENHCKNFYKIIKAEKNLPFIDFDLNEFSKLNKEVIWNRYNYDLCEKLRFDFKTNIGKYKDVKLFYRPPIGTCNEIPYRNNFEILINSKGQFLIENNFSSKKSIKESIVEFLQNNFDDYTGISIKCASDVDKSIITESLEKVYEGFFKAINQQSQKLYSKSLCELDRKEISMLSKKLELRLLIEKL